MDQDPQYVFDQALAYTLRHEGGYVFDPADPGGETRFGISKRSYPQFDIKELTLAEAEYIYRRDYWLAPRFNRIPNEFVAAKVFDLGVNVGTRRAAKLLQRALNQVCGGEIPSQRQSAWRQKMARLFRGKPLIVDGLIGPITIEVVALCPYPQSLLMALKGEAYQHYIKQKKPRFIAGWLTRLAGDA